VKKGEKKRVLCFPQKAFFSIFSGVKMPLEIATPELENPRLENGVRGQKTASGIFLGKRAKRAGKKRRNRARLHRVARVPEGKTASDANNHRNRYYNPNTGRWLSRDSKYFADGTNLYAYGHNSPTKFADPFGTTCSGDLLSAILGNGSENVYYAGEFGSGVVITAAGNTNSNNSSSFNVINGIGLTTNTSGTSTVIGYCQVNEYGMLEPVVNEDNWSILKGARENGFDNLADLLYESVVIHEQTHIDIAAERNPIITGSVVFGDWQLQPGAILGATASATNNTEWTAHQAQVDFLQECFDNASYNGQDLSYAELEMLYGAIQDVEDAQRKFKTNTTTP
jgi:RHS repeat-associated protein